MNNEFTIVPFADVKIGQEFESADAHQEMSIVPWIKFNEYRKRSAISLPVEGFFVHFETPCLVRTADCEPELDTCTWTYKEYAWESACGAEFVFTEEQDSLELNSFKFCHKCGCKIVEAK